MAFTVGNVINAGDINTAFITEIKNKIIENINHSKNIPMDGSYEMIPSNILGNLETLTDPNVGISNSSISALSIYNNLLEITKLLTCVGTWSYIRTYNSYGSRITQHSASGRALFISSYMRALPSVDNGGVVNGSAVSVTSIRQLFANLLAAWNNTEKYHNSKEVNLCHSSCHSSCYGNCYSDCRCYK